jgi:hypothetical protein
MIKKRKRRFVFPAPRVTGRFGNDYGTDIISWMDSVTLQYLGKFYGKRQPFPEASELALWLREKTLRDGGDYILSGQEGKAGKYRLSAEDLTRKTTDAAAFALLHFDPVFYDQRRKWGEDTSRGPSFTQADYAKYSHLTAAKAALAMGCSVRTIRRLRAALTPGSDEWLLAEMDAEIERTRRARQASVTPETARPSADPASAYTPPHSVSDGPPDLLEQELLTPASEEELDALLD